MAAPEQGDPTSGTRWLGDHVRRRAWVLLVMVVFTGVGMAFTLLWEPVVHHSQFWLTPGDVWSTWRAAHWVGWGDIGGVYGSDTQLVTLPGIAVVLAPFAMMSGHLGLSEDLTPIFLPHPTAWLILGPASLLIGSSCLLAFDAVAEELGVGRGLRRALCLVEAVVIFEVLALWGHPEDMLATGLMLYAVLAARRSHWKLSGWMWGAAIVVQPLVVVVLPVALSAVAAGRRVRLCVLAVIPPVILVAPSLISEWSATSPILLHQANYPRIDHPTPWMAIAPTLPHHAVGAGPGRVVAVALAVGLGVVAFRLRPSLIGLLWMGAVALSLRCVFESVMVPFYLGPPLAVIVLLAAGTGRWWRLGAAGAVAMVATVVSFHHLSEWVYWTPMVLFLAAGLTLAWPGHSALGGRYAEPAHERETPATAPAGPADPVGPEPVVTA